MGIERLPGLICVSETTVYAQINRFRGQINHWFVNGWSQACEQLNSNEGPDQEGTRWRMEKEKILFASNLKRNFT